MTTNDSRPKIHQNVQAVPKRKYYSVPMVPFYNDFNYFVIFKKY